MTIRPAESTDVPALAALEALCFGAEAWSAGQVDAELTAGRTVLVLTTAAAVVGYASVLIGPEDAELLRIAVDPACRRSGHGRYLLGAAMAAARVGGATRMLLEVEAGNLAAAGLYETAGFSAIARRRGYYRGRDALVMECGLR